LVLESEMRPSNLGNDGHGGNGGVEGFNGGDADIGGC